MAIAAGADALGLVARMLSGLGPISDTALAGVTALVPPPVATFLLTSETTVDAIFTHVRAPATTASTAAPSAPMSQRPAEKGSSSTALGCSRGVFTSKLHCLADALGRPLALHLTGGEAADCKAYDALIVLPERIPDALLADKGYDADAIRADLSKRHIGPVIRGRSNRRVKIEHDRTLYKQRNRIERMFGRLKINRAIATRYDQLPNSFLGMVHLATARNWL